MWTFLPPTLQRQWRFVCTHMVAGMGDCHELYLTTTPIASMQEYWSMASLPLDTKCAICRKMLPPEKCCVVPMHRFAEAQWLIGKEVALASKEAEKFAQLAPLWSAPSEFMLKFMVFTRVRISFQNGLEFITCGPCRQCPTKRHFFSQVFPHNILHKTIASRAAFLAPTSENIPWASVVRLKDRIVKGSRVGRRPNGSMGNIQWQTLAFGAHARGLSTQLITLQAPWSNFWRHKRGDPHHRGELETYVLYHRTDLHEYFAHVLGHDFKERFNVPSFMAPSIVDTCEGYWVQKLQKRAKKEDKDNDASMLTTDVARQMRQRLYGAVAGWPHPVSLPRCRNNEVAATIHALLVVPELKDFFCHSMNGDILERQFKCLARELLQGQHPHKTSFTTFSNMLRKAMEHVHPLQCTKDLVFLTIVELCCVDHDTLAATAYDVNTMDRIQLCCIAIDYSTQECMLPAPLFFLSEHICKSNIMHAAPPMLLIVVHGQPTTSLGLERCFIQDPCYFLHSIVQKQGSTIIAYVRGRNSLGNHCWFECGDGRVEELHELNYLDLQPNCAMYLLYSHTEFASFYKWNPHKLVTHEESEEHASMLDDAVDVDPLVVPAEIAQATTPTQPYGGDFEVSHDVGSDTSQEEHVAHEEDSLEYTSPKQHLNGVHVLLTTLAELNASERPAQWLKNFTTAVTCRLPNFKCASEYLEAFSFPSHFPMFDEGGHFFGVMPMKLYKERDWKCNPFVTFEDYAEEVLCDPHSTRQCDPSWLAFAFNIVLMRILDKAPHVKFVQQGMAEALWNYRSQDEYGARFGHRVYQNLLYN